MLQKTVRTALQQSGPIAKMGVMNPVNLSRIDLNLLVVFDAVLFEGHVTRAANRLGLTQPAVSHALGRLRTLFGDPLFVKTPRGMAATPLAQEVGPAVRAMLEQVESVLARDRSFDPATSDRCFRIGLSDYSGAVLLPGLVALLAAEAPGVSLIVLNATHATGLPMLEDGEVELIAGCFPEPPPHLREETLFLESFVCARRRRRGGTRGLATLRDYLAGEHLQISTRGSPFGQVDEALAARGASRTVKLTVAHFLLAPPLLRASDLIATEPSRFLSAPGVGDDLTLTKPPFPIPPFTVTQNWHSRHDNDPAHTWLRTLLRTHARDS